MKKRFIVLFFVIALAIPFLSNALSSDGEQPPKLPAAKVNCQTSGKGDCSTNCPSQQQQTSADSRCRNCRVDSKQAATCDNCPEKDCPQKSARQNCNACPKPDAAGKGNSP